MSFLEPVREVNQFTGFGQICQHTLGVNRFELKLFHRGVTVNSGAKLPSTERSSQPEASSATGVGSYPPSAWR